MKEIFAISKFFLFIISERDQEQQREAMSNYIKDDVLENLKHLRQLNENSYSEKVLPYYF